MLTTKDVRRGRMSYLTTDVYIGQALDLYGEVFELELQFLEKLIKPGDVVIDIGANIGTHTIVFSKAAGPLGIVHAFEPQPRVFEILLDNIAQNNLDNVQARNIAIGAEPKTLTIPAIDYDHPGNFGSMSLDKLPPDEPGLEVQMLRLDDLGLERVNFIKLDVEGFESRVLQGATHTLLRNKPILYVEADRLEKLPLLIDILARHHYHLYWHTEYLFNPDNAAGEKNNVFRNITSWNLLCVHKDQDVPLTKTLRKCNGPFDHPNRKESDRIKNGWACVVRFGGIGDNLMAASAVGALKRKGYKVEVVTSHDAAWQVFENNPNIDKLSVKSKSEIPKDNLKAWQDFFRGRADEYEVFAHLSHSCEGMLALFTASTQFYWPASVRRKYCNHNYLEIVHDIAQVPYDFGPLFYSSEAEREFALETKRKVGPKCIAWCISGTRVDKIHPYTAGIIARLLKEVGVPIVILGAPGKNYEDAKKIHEHVKRTNSSDEGLHVAISAFVDPEGKKAIEWPIRRSLSFAQTCDLVIGPDTGIMWGVAFEDMPKISLLSHASPENITKHWKNTYTLTANPMEVPCWPCHQLHDTTDTCTPNAENNGAACMTSISVETIVSTVKKVWKQIS